MDMDNIIEMYAEAVMDVTNESWNLEKVPPQIKDSVIRKIEELKEIEGGENK